MIKLTASIPAGTEYRLVEHYGPWIRTWLAGVQNTMAATASQANVTIRGFHDAGWTSVVAVGQCLDGNQVVLKAFPDPDRYHHERAALTHWAGHGACRLLDAIDRSKILLIELVGGAAGGSPQPSDDIERVADALPRLHQLDVDSNSSVPRLSDYYRTSVLPRIEQRATRFGAAIGGRTVHRALSVGAQLCAETDRQAMLHSDLYSENVIFDMERNPVFIDPHPKVGTPAFDWAFWCVYYRQDGQFAARIAACRSRVPDLAGKILEWSLTLAVDGALYYTEHGEPDAEAMHHVLKSPELAHIG